MEKFNGLDMRLPRKLLCLTVLIFIFVIWKLLSLEADIRGVEYCKDIFLQNKELLRLSHQQLSVIEHFYEEKVDTSLPTIYAITPTYYRLVQKADLTRLSQTLRLVPNLHWIVVEDSETATDLVTDLLNESHIIYTHLVAKTPPFEKLQEKDPRWKKHRGIEQRNSGLKWLRDNLVLNKDKGVVYFLDDDNTYSVKLFDEMSRIKKVGIWPVGLVGGLNAEAPIVDKKTGKVTGYKSGFKPDRKFAIDMAGFAINLDLILAKADAQFSYKMAKGYQETEFLSYFITRDDLEPLASNCSKVYVWHTRTENPKVKGFIEGLEV